MSLREISFSSTKQLVAYINSNGLSKSQVEAIIPNQQPEAPSAVTLIFWEDGSALSPLEEGNVPSQNRSEPLPHTISEEEIPMPITSKEIADVNIRYTQSRIATDERRMEGETTKEYLYRKDLELAREKEIKQNSYRAWGGEERVKESIKDVERVRIEKPTVKEEIKKSLENVKKPKPKSCNEEQEKWELVMDWWNERYPKQSLDLPYDRIQFKKNSIAIPEELFGDRANDIVLYDLGLIAKAIFGKESAIGYLK
jgi:hypothetical protein